MNKINAENLLLIYIKKRRYEIEYSYLREINIKYSVIFFAHKKETL